MKNVVVRYQVKPERVAEHEALIRDVFEALAQEKPHGLSYEVLKLEDGVSFIHHAKTSVAENPLLALAAFKRFTADIKSRAVSAPVSSTATVSGSYAGPRTDETA